MKILVVGISVRAMVESAVHSNYRVLALDAFGDRDLEGLAESRSLRRDFHIPYSADALYEAGRRFDFDAVAYTSNLENHPEVLDRFASRCKLIGNSPRAVRNVRDWPSLFSRLKDAGFQVPETIFANDDREFTLERQWLVKPALSGGGHGISFLREKKAPGSGFVLQRYIPGKSCSASFVANGREAVVLGITEQLAGMRQFGTVGFRYCGNILPLPEALDADKGGMILAQVRGISEFLTCAFGLTGVNGFDFIFNGGQVWLIEVNPRYSASMELIERAYGLPLFHLHTQAVVDGVVPKFSLESQFASGKYFGKAILYCERDSTASGIPDWQARNLRDVPHEGEKLRKGSPVCTFLADGPTYQETYDQLISRAEAIRKEIYG